MYYFNHGVYQNCLIMQPLLNMLSLFDLNYAKVIALKSTCLSTEKI